MKFTLAVTASAEGSNVSVTADTTPLYIIAVSDFVKVSGDVEMARDSLRDAGIYFTQAREAAPDDPITNDIAEILVWCASRPPHVCIDELLVKCTDQAAVHKLHRRPVGK